MTSPASLPLLSKRPPSARSTSPSPKRRRTASRRPLEHHNDAQIPPPPRGARLAGVKVPNPANSPSLFWQEDGGVYKPPPSTPEAAALQYFLGPHTRRSHASSGHVNVDGDSDDSIYVYLTSFDIYRPADKLRHPGTLASLNEMGNGVDTLAFDGLLRHGSESRYVTGVKFRTVSIEGYGRRDPTHGTVVYIQSLRNTGSRVWYWLLLPSSLYKIYHQPFLWLADFSIYFVAYLERRIVLEQPTSLRHFQHDFHRWLLDSAVRHPGFESWLAEYGRTDFRHIIIANFDFLWKQATDVNADMASLPFWKEFDGSDLRAIKARPVREDLTVVTPFAYECFSSSYFKDSLKQVEMTEAVHTIWTNRAKAMGLSCLTRRDLDVQNAHHRHEHVEEIGRVKRGDVVVVASDVDGLWAANDDGWLAYVQGIREDRHGPYLDLIWLYKPEDTICRPGYFPFSNELFMSDHCNCGDARVRPADIKRRATVDFFAKNVESIRGLYVRQAYITPDEEGGKDAAFCSLKKEHFHCWHLKETIPSVERARLRYPPGSTVLVYWADHSHLQPAVVEAYIPGERVCVRHLARRVDFDGHARPNELLDTPKTYRISPSSIVRECIVRRFPTSAVKRGEVPAPYSYGGSADAWCLTGLLSSASGTEVIEEVDLAVPIAFREGFDPDAPSSTQKLRGLSLFSGGGSFDRGLEEGQAVETKYVVEMATAPMHTYRANLPNPERTKLYLGSVNDFLSHALKGGNFECIASVGGIDIIVAGSPCKGFSLATQDKMSEKAKGYASLVASVIAFINLYCPAYAVLENVTDMCTNVKGEKAENVFSQIVSALVAMGYQVSIANCDAWTMGSAQSRSRMFILATAPNLEPLAVPPQTHEHPPRTSFRGVGRTQCGVRYGLRTPASTVCPFPYVSARQATEDLPYLGDGKVRTCIPFPDHRTGGNAGYKFALTMRAIPRFPLQQSFASARSQNQLGKAILELYGDRKQEWHANSSKAFTRINPNLLFPTVKTSVRPDCARMGSCVHWDEHRSMTIMEARRAQSIPDHEVLVGNPAQQFLVVGNGVDRKASVSLGMSLRRSWLSPRTRKYFALMAPEQTAPEAPIINDAAEEDLQRLRDPQPATASEAPVINDADDEDWQRLDDQQLPTPPPASSQATESTIGRQNAWAGREVIDLSSPSSTTASPMVITIDSDSDDEEEDIIARAPAPIMWSPAMHFALPTRPSSADAGKRVATFTSGQRRVI